ncbi:MAG: signal peptidase II [Hyphomicrobium sp.]|jgi:signal peptidase II|nr:signal peptidase II [Hyphomicrobium sp.]
MSLPASAPDTQEKEPSSQGWFWGPYAPLGAAVALATLVLDQANKLWMLLVYGIEGRGRVEVTPFLDFVYVLNTGVSYSMFDSSSYSWQLGLAAFALAASLGMWIWLCKAGESRLMAWGLSLIIGGALGNAIDRLWLGGVADFYSLHAFGFYWYVFNIADVAIVAGVVALLYDSFIASRKDAAKTS